MILGWGQPCRIIVWWCDHSLALLPRFLEMQWVLLEVVSYVSWFCLEWLPLCLLPRRGMGRMASCTVGGVGLLSEDLCLSCLFFFDHSQTSCGSRDIQKIGVSSRWSQTLLLADLFPLLRSSGLEILVLKCFSRPICPEVWENTLFLCLAGVAGASKKTALIR